MITQLIPLLLFAAPQADALPDISGPGAIDPVRIANYEAERARLASRTPSAPQPVPDFDPQRVAAEALGVNELPGGGAIASGPNWSARWSDGKLRFDGLGAAPDFLAATLELELHEIARESGLGFGLALERNAAVSLLRDDDPYAARVQRALAGGVAERWDLLPEGVELSYVLDVLPPGAGDLVVRLELRTDLVARLGPGLPGQDLAFVGPGGSGIHVGSVTGIDASGVTCDGQLGWDGAQLELRLPASFVDEAALPLVIDPTITSSARINGTGSTDESPDVAWDEDTRTWAVAFKRRLGPQCPWYPSGSWHYNVLVQRLSITGWPKGTAVVLGTDAVPDDFTTFTLQTGDETPDIVNLNGRDEFVVVVATPTTCLPNSCPEDAGSILHVLRVRASDGYHHMSYSGSRSVSGYAMNIELGADPLPDYPNLLMTWARKTGFGSQTKYAVRSMLVRVSSAGGVAFDPERSIVSPGGLSASFADLGLALTPSAGQAGRWLVAWSSYDAWGGSSRIKGKVIRWDGLIESPTTSLASSSSSARVEDPRLAGDGANVVLQYTYGGSSILAKPVTISSGSPAPGAPVAIPDGDGLGWHDVAQLGDGFVSVRTENATGAHTLHATSFDSSVSPASMETMSRWMPHRLVYRTRVSGMGESKPIEADDQVMAVWKRNLGGIYRARIRP